MIEAAPIPPPIPPHLENSQRITFKCATGKKVTKWQAFVFAIFCILLICIAQPPLLLGAFLVLSCAVFSIAIYAIINSKQSNITYTVEGKYLLISHPMSSLTINIHTIKRIRRGDFLIDRGGHNFSASYPNIHILYETNKYVYISPEDEQGLLKILHKINPNITIRKDLNVN